MNTVAELQQEIEHLRQQLSQVTQLVSARDAEIIALRERIQQFLLKRFAASSEKISPDQLGLFNEAEALAQSAEIDDASLGEDTEAQEVEPQADDAITVQGHTRKRRPRVAIPEHYPREEIVYDLSEAEKICPHDGMAAKPRQPIEKSIASPGLLAFVAVQKYDDALPLYRQSEMFERIDIALERTSLARWMVSCGALVQPLINLFTEHILRQAVVHMDETTLQVLDEPGKAPQSQSYLWLLAAFGTAPALVFHYAPTRSQAVPRELLGPQVSALMVDGYAGYNSVCAEYGITRLGCMAHARRRFVEAKAAQPKGKTGRADQALAYFQKLYALEAACRELPADERYRVRQAQAWPVLEQLKRWRDKTLLQVPPSSVLGKALNYLVEQWRRLIGYLEDGHYPIDNNAAENAIRPFAVGRRNWLFAKSQAGAKASANLYSLIETAKANGLNPYTYLKHVFTVLPNAQALEDVEALLPWRVQLG
jgi:transposase